MSITFNGLATGIDTDSIITKLMEVERAPINRLETKKAAETNRLEAFAQFKTTLDDLKSAVSAMALTSQVKSTSVALNSDAPFTATSANASTGSYNIAVKQLAQVQKNISAGWASQTDAVLGTGTFTITHGTEDTVFTIDSSNNSLQGLLTAINEQTAETGVKATLINDGTTGTGATPYHIIFTGADPGTEFTLASDLEAEDTTPITFTTTVAQPAQQAKILVDGLEVVSNSNTITDVISGVTLNLDAVSDTETADPLTYKTSLLTISQDTSALKEKITNFVTSYNKTMEWILSGYDEFTSTSDTTTTEEDTTEEELLGSVLRGDSTIQGIKRGLQSILTSVVDTGGSKSILAQLGITTKLNGTLLQDNTVLDAALKDDFDGVADLLAGKDSVDGVMKKFNYYLLDITSGTTGMYANKKKSYDLTVERIDTQILYMEPRMLKREESLRSQFSAMETLVSGLNSQGDFLTQQMELLSNMLKGNN